jgi:hypothetical protein
LDFHFCPSISATASPTASARGLQETEATGTT